MESRKCNALHCCHDMTYIFLIVSDSRDKGKDTVAVFIDFIYNHFGATDAMEDIIWSDGPTSEFKNKCMVKFLQSLSQKYNQ